MNASSQRACVVGGPLCVVLTVLALWPAAGFFPPMPPGLSASDIAAIYADRSVGIRLAGVLTLMAGACYAAFTAAAAAQTRRMETRETPVLTYLQLVCGAVVTVLFIAIAVHWSLATFRPERSPEITQLLNDLGWFWFLFTATVPALQLMALGFAILGDKAAQPVLPRWLGYVNLWIAVLFLPGVLLAFFKTGPFAWNGLFVFWLPAAVFGLWFLITAGPLFGAIRRQEAEAR